MGKLKGINGRLKKRGHLGTKVIVVAMSGILITGPFASIAPESWGQMLVSQASAAATTQLKLKSQSMLTSGAKRLDYIFYTNRSNKSVQTDVHVIEVDLTNPYVSLDTMSGKSNSVGQRNNILNMTNENGAIGGINGDVFIMSNSEGAPLGAQVQGGELTSSPSKLKGMYAFALTKDRKPVIDSYSFTGTVTAQNGNTFPLEGLNKSAYYPEVDGVTYSHVDAMYIYTSEWGGAERPMNSATKPTEALIIDGVVAEIKVNEAIKTAIPENGYVLRAHGAASKFIQENLKAGEPVTADYALMSKTLGTKIDPSTYDMLIGGHTLLVDNSAAAPFSRDIAGVSGNSYTSRSGIGYSKDGTKVYLITAEKSGGNTGLSLKELQQVMVQLGVHKGMNLDGGGSTTMTERPLGSTSLQLAHPTQESSQRAVTNGIGVFTNAPQGKLKGMIVKGANIMLLGQSMSYSTSGYDTYYNPMTVDPASQTWSTSAAVGTFSGNVFTATKIGKTKVTVTSGDVTSSYDVEVIGQDQIASMRINASAGMLASGSALQVPITVKLKNGSTYNLSGDSFAWEFVGFDGEYKNGAVAVNGIEPDTTTGYAIARYDGYGAMIPFVKGEQAATLEDFEVSRYLITSQVTPKETTKGSVKLVSDLPEQKSGKALQISYDFSSGTGTRASYAVLGNGLTLAGSPTSLTMDVYSDTSNNWVRAEIVDTAGKVHLLDIAKELNWTGWKNVKIDLAAAGVAFPAKLKRVYVVTLGQADVEKIPVGAIAIDNLALRTAAVVKEPARASIVMTVGSSKATVNGKALTLEAAPLIQKGSTYVPLRFVTEAMGAEVLYDEKTRRVTVLRGSQMLEMTIGRKDYTLNGVRYTSDVAPFTKNGRTLIPIRLFSEKLGFKVKYEDKLRQITID
ncbi:stalk domain-containing protein [Paenibacillus sp. LHD-117]|uniref:stalk domain-containing protein n=1 Tax=Paenibacillus sp. LHD-117 TaxID=3071412 RepID=UPI0027E05D45|nr:stalk domain-containing protein [Paenibacillus sp. LHD-117]MDQ6422516.1 stalk domain-containing protein [Paenibacillus sp. LHD-117]